MPTHFETRVDWSEICHRGNYDLNFATNISWRNFCSPIEALG